MQPETPKSRKRYLVPFLRSSRSATGTEGALKAEACCGVQDPVSRTIGPSASCAQPEGRQLLPVQRLIDEIQPTIRPRHGPFTEQGCRLPRAAFATPETTPSPVLCSGHQVGSQGVTFDVATHRQEIPVALNRERLESALVQMAATAHPLKGMPAKRMRSRKPSEVPRKVPVPLGMKHHVPVVWHQAISKDAHRNTILGFRHHLLEGSVITRPLENPRTPIGPVQDMIHNSTDGNTRGSWHVQLITSETHRVKKKRFQVPFLQKAA